MRVLKRKVGWQLQENLVQLGTGGRGENELGSNEAVAGNAEPYSFSVEVFEGLEVLRRRASFE